MYNDSRNAICSTPSSNTSDYIAASAFSPFNTAAITAYLTMPTDEKRTSIFNLYINIITLFIHHVKRFCIKKYGYREATETTAVTMPDTSETSRLPYFYEPYKSSFSGSAWFDDP